MEFNAAKSRAAILCSQQERCSSYIREKLNQWNVSDGDVNNIISFLLEEKFLDNNRYAAFYVKDKFRLNKWGKIKIRYSLRQKQIPEEAIEAAIKQITDDEYVQTCKQLLSGKSKSIKDNNHFSKKAKLLRFAAQRGFESEVIYRAMEQLSQ